MKKSLAVLLCLTLFLPACGISTSPAAPLVVPSASPDLRRPALTPLQDTATIQAAAATPSPTPLSAASTPTASSVPPTPTPLPGWIGPGNFSQFAPIQIFTMKLDDLLVEQFGLASMEWRMDSWEYSPDGRYAAFGGCTTTSMGDVLSCQGEYRPFLYILDAESGDLVTSIAETDAAITDLSFSPDGKWLVYAVKPYRLVQWDLSAGRVERTLWQESGNRYYPRTRISPDGKQVVLKIGPRVVVFDLATGHQIADLPVGSYGASFPKYNRDGTRLVVYSKDDGSEVAFYDTSTWQVASRVQITDGGDLAQAVDYSPDGRWLANATSSEDTRIQLWDVGSGELAADLEEPLDYVFLQFSPDGRLLLVCGLPGEKNIYDTIAVWDVASRQRLGIIRSVGFLTQIMFDASGVTFMTGDIMGYQRWSLPDADLLKARQVLTGMLDAMAAGDYEAAAAVYQPNDEEKVFLGAEGYKASDRIGVITKICAQPSAPCALKYQFFFGGMAENGAYLGDIRAEYLFLLTFTRPDGSTYRDSYGNTEFYSYVQLMQDGSAQVIMLPSLFMLP